MLTSKIRSIIALGALLIFTALVFLPSLENGFINWDDQIYVTDNQAIKDLSPAGIAGIFGSFHHGLYKPLVLFSYALEYHFFKLNPFIYHFDNLLLHLLNTLLVFWLIRLLSKRVLISFLAALLFGIHPLHVESVAWVTERKDMLYAFFFLGSLISYLYYRQRNLRRYYYFSLCLAAISFLAKPMGVTLAFILLACDYLQERKIGWKSIRDKIPFLGIAILAVLINILALHFDPIKDRQMPWVFPDNLFFIGYALVFYLQKLFLPLGLSCFYPYPEKVAGSLPVVYLFSPLIVVFLAWLVVWSLRYTRKAAFGSLFFLLALLPALPWIPTSTALVADRYTYISAIGIFYLAAESFFWIYTRRIKFASPLRVGLVIILSAALSFLATLAFQRSQVWKDSITLWNDAIKNGKGDLAIPYNNRGAAYLEKGNVGQAFSDYNQAIKFNPAYAKAYHNRGVIYADQGKLEEALSDYSRAIALEPRYADAYNNRGRLRIRLGRIEEALADFNQAIRLNSGLSDAYNNRGNIYFNSGKTESALADYSRAVKFDPRYAEARNNLGSVYFRQGRMDDALAEYNRAIESSPRYAEAYNNRGIVYVRRGKITLAIADFNQAIDLGLKSVDVYINRGAAYAGNGEFERAIADYNQAVALDPKSALAYNNRGYAYARTKNFALALIDCNKAIALKPQEGNFYDSRAYVYFQRQEYAQSREDARKAQELGYPVEPKFLQELEQALTPKQ